MQRKKLSSANWKTEFAQRDKGEVKIVNVLRHDSKLNKLKYRLELEWGLSEQIKQNKIGEVIEQTK